MAERQAPSQVERLVADSLSSGGHALDATLLAIYAQSPFAAWCSLFASPEKRDPLDDFHRMLFEEGREHEARILGERSPGVEGVARALDAPGFRATLDAMARGDATIAGAALFHPPLKGLADLLVRCDDAPSAFGSYHYVVHEIKLAKNIQPHHILQASAYHAMLSKIQDYTPRAFVLINRDGVEARVAFDEAALDEALVAVREIVDGREPAPIHGAGVWPWCSANDARAEQMRDVSCVSGVGAAARARLADAGFATYDALARADVDDLQEIHGIGAKRSAQLIRNAEALVTGKPIRISHVRFPLARTEIFLDLEGTGAQTTDAGLVEMDYLIGCLARRDGSERYMAFVAPTRDEAGERAMFEEFLSWYDAQEDPLLYHWSAYEKTHLRRLAERHGIEPSREARVFGRLRDLLADATHSFAFPTYGASIKKIAPWLGFQWRHKDVNAMASIALYFAYAADPEANAAKLQKVLDYNEDDCIAMRVVKDWLVAQSA